MGYHELLERSLTKFGMHNSPTVVAMGIATAKGIFRPLFTMMDKKEDYEPKRYAAIREGLTELIAIPVYFLSGVASEKIAKKISVPKNFMPKDVFKKYKAGDMSPKVAETVKQATKLAKENLGKIQISTSFIGVCASALFIIPMICSATIKPVMNLITKPKQDNKQTLKSINPANKVQKKVNVYGNLTNSYNQGMKVGGV